MIQNSFADSTRCAGIPGCGVAVVICLFLLMPGCQSNDDAAATEGKRELPLIDVPLLVVERRPWPTIVRSQGSLVADEIAVIGSRLEGRVEAVHVDLGDRVTAGTPLIRLHQSEFQLKVAQAEAQLQQARSAVGLGMNDEVTSLDPENAPPVLEQKALWNEAAAALERAEQLKNRSSITAGEFEQIVAAAAVAEARYRSAVNGVREKIALIGVRQAELELAEEDLQNTVVIAPFDGYVQQRTASPGSSVRVGDPLVTVVRTSRLRFRGTIPERHAPALTEGQQVELKVESIDEPLQVRVTRVSPSLDLLSRALLFEAEVENSDDRLRTGLFAEARIEVDSRAEAIVIPHTALSEFAGAEKVWKVTAGQSHEQEVLTGERRESGIEILQGLAPGDVILRNAADGLVARVVQSESSDSFASRPSSTDSAAAN